jgi:hypothetical protein
MSEKRVTKSEMYTEIRDILSDEGYDDLAEFCQKEIDALAAKAAKAKEKAAEKKSEHDDLEIAVASALTADLQTGAQVFEAVDAGDEEFATLGKVRARLTKLVKAGAAVKEEMKVTDGDKTRTVMGYRLAA